MRERHNIVGSEVNRPRPPVYLSDGGAGAGLRRKRRRPAVVVIRVLALLAVVLVLAGLLLRGS